MVAKKGSKSAGEKTLFILGRDMSEDDMIKAIKKMCDKAGMKFKPASKPRKKKK